MSKSLYRVKLTRFEAYVVAENPTAAYEAFKNYLDEQEIGYYKDRELKSIEVVGSEEAEISSFSTSTILPLIL